MTEKKEIAVAKMANQEIPITNKDVFYATIDLTKEFLHNQNFSGWSDADIQTRLNSFMSSAHDYVTGMKT